MLLNFLKTKIKLFLHTFYLQSNIAIKMREHPQNSTKSGSILKKKEVKLNKPFFMDSYHHTTIMIDVFLKENNITFEIETT